MPKPTIMQVSNTLTDRRLLGPAWVVNVANEVMSLIDVAWAESEAEHVRTLETALTNERAFLASQLERGRKALEILGKFMVRHADTCRIVATAWEGMNRPDCTCGLHGALTTLNAPYAGGDWTLKRDAGTVTHAVCQTKPESPAKWGYATERSEQVERHNDLQRARREAWVSAAQFYDAGQPADIGSRLKEWGDEIAGEAAKQYPVKVRRRRVFPDPHGDGEWTTDEQVMSGFTHAIWRVREDDKLSPDTSPFKFTPERVALMQSLLDQPYEWVDDTSPEA